MPVEFEDLGKLSRLQPDLVVARMSFGEESYLSPGSLRYDLDTASTLLAGFVWVGASGSVDAFRRAEWEPTLKVSRFHYGSPVQLDVTAIGAYAAGGLAGLYTLSRIFDRVAHGVETLSRAQKTRAEAREIDQRVAHQVAMDAIDDEAEDADTSFKGKLIEIVRPARVTGTRPLDPQTHLPLPDQSEQIGSAFRRIALRGGRIQFRRTK